ncbi:MAG: hypothetical protein LUC24_00785, partial [Bacteroidales bacterium]|nr:hypothetical protein [Bacteroidales bacterium]
MKIKGLILAATVLWTAAAPAEGMSAWPIEAEIPGSGNENWICTEVPEIWDEMSAEAGVPGPENEDRAAILDVKGIFQSKYEEPGVAESFVAGKRWLPCPEYGDRAGWEELFGPDRD